LQGHENEIFGLAFSADGKTLASASDDETIRLWDVLRQRPIGGPLQGELPMAFSREGIVAYLDITKIVLWDVSARRELMHIPLTERAFEYGLNAIAFSPDGRTLAAADSEDLVTLWNVGGKAAVGRCLGGRSLDHGAPVGSIAFSTDGQTLVSAGEDGKLRYWRVDGCRPQGKAVQAHTRGISSVVFSLQGDLVASTGSGQVRLWDARTHAEVGRARDSHEDVSSLAFSPDGRTLTAVGIPGTIKVWDVSGGKALEASSSGGAASGLAISPDGRFVALVRGDPVYPPVPGGTIEIWDATTRTRLGAQIPLSPYAADVAFSPDSRILASSGFMFDPDRARETPQIRLWDVATRKPLGEAVRTGTADPGPIAFAQGGKLLASASEAAIALWEVPTLRRLRTIRANLDYVTSIASSPDGKMLASAGYPPKIELRDLDHPERIRGTLDAGGVHEVVDLAFSTDGRTLAAVRSDGTIRLWDVRTLHPRAGLPGGGFESAWSVAFSRDGRTLGYVYKGGIRFWDLASETALGEPLTSQSSTNAILFSPIDDLLVSAGENPPLVWWDGVLWSDELGAFKRQLCPIVGRNLTQEEWAKFLPGEPYHRTCG
jgi:WD40 repeat protein